MNITKSETKNILNSHFGYGWIVFKSGDKKITQIEIYRDRNNKVRRVHNGKELLPLEKLQDNEQ